MKVPKLSFTLVGVYREAASVSAVFSLLTEFDAEISRREREREREKERD